MVRAEDVYTALLRDDVTKMRPGARGSVTFTLEKRVVTSDWEIRQNAVWRRGRVFLECPKCRRRCTRLYLPLTDSWRACRRCWGLTYNSRTLLNLQELAMGTRSVREDVRNLTAWLGLPDDPRRPHIEAQRFTPALGLATQVASQRAQARYGTMIVRGFRQVTWSPWAGASLRSITVDHGREFMSRARTIRPDTLPRVRRMHACTPRPAECRRRLR